MVPRILIAAVGLIGMLSCVESEPERPIYDRGEIGVLLIRNPTDDLMAIGGCNPVHGFERVASRWIPDGLMRLACVDFGTAPDGSHELSRYQLIRPQSVTRVGFATDWISQPEATIRFHHRVSVGCRRPAARGGPLQCSGSIQLVSDPILVVEPGTADAHAR